MLKCVIIDDEPLARECIAGYIAKVEFLELAGEGTNPLDLIALLDKEHVDLVFLDIQMPVMNGIDFLKTAQNRPMVIITTAYPKYALDGFQLDVMDYLVKPITFARFVTAINKARDYHKLLAKSGATSAEPGSTDEYFFIKSDYRYERIYFNEILYVEAMQNYVTFYTTKGKYIALLNLKNVEQNLNDQSFMRVHKSYIVSISKIDTIEDNEILIQGFRIPVSRNYKDDLIKRVVEGKLWRK
ncbi:MAG: LytTR family DNA-binding domain-containing protein [Bacteroidota bacterium]